MGVNIEKLINEYGFNYDEYFIDDINRGNVNTTFIINIVYNNSISKYLCQWINTEVFKDPYILSNNIYEVTTYINNLYSKNNDSMHTSLCLIPTSNNKYMYVEEINGKKLFYRVYKYIDDTICYDNCKDLSIIYNVGEAFGNFSKLLNNFPINKLDYTIKNFHNTSLRYDKLINDINIDSCNRIKNCADEIDYIKNQAPYDEINVLLEKKLIPLRVIHNDTKINNVLLDKNTKKFKAVIDLDTVMPGTILYDFGDGVRSSCASLVEDSADFDNVEIDLDLFRSYTDGFLKETHGILTETEVKYLSLSVKIITLECAIRFLDDYICGDTYFHIRYNDHNLIRAKNQIALAKSIESKYDQMNSIVYRLYNNYKKKISG